MAKSLQVGDTIPAIMLKNQHGQQIELYKELGDGPIVLFFYPKDNTRGCIKEVCAFRDNQDEFNGLNVKVFGISADSVQSHEQFANAYNLNFSILSDSGNKVRKQFGVPSNMFGLVPGRVTYIIQPDHRISHVFNSLTNPAQHVEEALKELTT